MNYLIIPPINRIDPVKLVRLVHACRAISYIIVVDDGVTPTRK